MRLVFVNHMHPATPHVSGMRAWYFARELAKQGHRVVLICESRVGVEPAPKPEHLSEQLYAYDWSQPFVIAVKPRPAWLSRLVHAPRMPAFSRKVLVVWSYLRHSGVFSDFSQGVQPYLPVIASEFRPEAAWGIFGNTDCWLVAQRLARLAHCPWVADMKDSWESFLRPGLRGTLARRFRDMAAATANAEFTARVLERWFPPKPVVVYSGADACWFDTELSREADFRIMLMGSLYGEDRFTGFVRGVMRWLQDLSEVDRGRVIICYAGGERAKFKAASVSIEALCRLELHDYLSQPDLMRLCHRAAVNVYLWFPRGFHHKLIELLCARRPIISFPGEYPEACGLAEQVGGRLYVCQAEEDLRQALGAIWRNGHAVYGKASQLRRFNWEGQAERLREVFASAVRSESPCAG